MLKQLLKDYKIRSNNLEELMFFLFLAGALWLLTVGVIMWQGRRIAEKADVRRSRRRRGSRLD
jgi:hypothetical protein